MCFLQISFNVRYTFFVFMVNGIILPPAVSSGFRYLKQTELNILVM